MATITVKNIPDAVYGRLKAAAESNRRSINSEIIIRLERSLGSHRVPTKQLMARISQLCDTFEGKTINPDELDAARREGRP
jgi:plasmid stability protein